MASGLKGHLDLYGALPEELTVVTTPGKPGYHVRNTLAAVLDEEMIASIMEQGVIESTLVGRDGDDLILIDGRQRRAMTLEANKRLAALGQPPKKVPFRTTRLPPEKWGLLASHANINRKSPPTLLAEEAADLERNGATKEEIALAMGVKGGVKGVDALLRLLDCAAVVKTAVDAGKVSRIVANDLASIPRAQQGAALEKMVAAGATKGARARKAVAAVRKGKDIPVTAPRMRNQADLSALHAALMERDLKSEGNAVLAVLQWALRLPGESDQCDDVAYALNDIAEAKTATKGKAA